MPDPIIAVDVMGGDHAPAAIVEGAVAAARAGGVQLILVGPADRVRVHLAGADASHPAIRIVDAPDVVAMDESPLAALRHKPRASIRVACALVRDGHAGAVLSAGHTGATFLAAHAALGLLPGLERAALAVIVPTEAAPAVLIDAGASVECRASHLVQFGVMGSAYARVALGRDRPSVGLLSIGEEAGKGTDLVREAHAELARTGLHFIGNIEARDVFTGRADVVVCDGFTGNVVLKIGEGLAEMFDQALRQELAASWRTRLGAWLSRPALRRVTRRLDDAERGAAPLVGINGVVLVAHGRSSPRAISNAIRGAAALVDSRFVDRTREALAQDGARGEGH